MNLPSVRITRPAGLEKAVDIVLADLERDAAVARIWSKDASLWKDRDVEISNRLGWLDAPEAAAARAGEKEAFADELRDEGVERVLLLGMGGSSLAPGVFSRVFKSAPGRPRLLVLDSTAPAAVVGLRRELSMARTLFLVSSKSGTTLETSSFLNFFYGEAVRELGPSSAGRRFAVITDPGTPLDHLRISLGFRRGFAGDPCIGGRFSALSPFGLVPAAILGVDIRNELEGARRVAAGCRISQACDNPGALLGAALGAAALEGVDKLAVLLPPRWTSLGAWIEQLVAESTGKEGRGILPLGLAFTEESLFDLGPDVLFLTLFSENEDGEDAARLLDRAARAGRPLGQIAVGDGLGLGGLFFLWEFAVAVAGRVLGINPFDQPDVAAAKTRTAEALALAGSEGRWPKERPSAAVVGAEVFADFETTGPAEALRRFASGAGAGDYLAVQAFLPPEPAVHASVEALARRLQALSRRPTAFDFGPRFLHSTGQLHKGDRGNGLFLQITAAHPLDAAIPTGPAAACGATSFGTLIDAQAWGDRRALRDKGRRLLRIHLLGNPAEGLHRLERSLSPAGS